MTRKLAQMTTVALDFSAPWMLPREGWPLGDNEDHFNFWVRADPTSSQFFNEKLIYRLFSGFDADRMGGRSLTQEALVELKFGLRKGWSSVERTGVWSVGKTAELLIKRPASNKVRAIELVIHPFLTQCLLLTISCGMARLHEVSGSKAHTLIVPLSNMEYDENISIKFFFAHTGVPASSGGSGNDTRELGIFVVGCRTLAEPELIDVIASSEGIRWKSLQPAELIFCNGWSDPTDSIRWTVGKNSTLVVGAPSESAALKLDVAGYCPTGHSQTFIVETSHSSHPVEFIRKDGSRTIIEIPLTKAPVGGEPIWLNVFSPDALAPNSVSHSTDARTLGLALYEAS